MTRFTRCEAVSRFPDECTAGRLEHEDLEGGLQITELPEGPSLEWLQKQLLQHLLPKLAPEAGSRVEGRPHRTPAGPSRTSIPEFVANLQRFCTQLGSTLQQLNGLGQSLDRTWAFCALGWGGDGMELERQ